MAEQELQKRFEDLYSSNEFDFLNFVVGQLFLSIIHDKKNGDSWGFHVDDIKLLKLLNSRNPSELEEKIGEALAQKSAEHFFLDASSPKFNKIDKFFKKILGLVLKPE